ncbi:hypothetical protein TWF225_002807 [Orbilia oligospora]|nr:hypothetical protein TWF225_002807 [Orbilia oligospora]KAF3249372.1 hypothetical protein TWF128_007805 [Orbilia oligospora]KAF3297927.1 hypothetical protein TWF132_004072 [Orbilia oligospora]
MKFISAILIAVLSAAAMAAPTPDENATLEKRGCGAGVICISGKCRYWNCNYDREIS